MSRPAVFVLSSGRAGTRYVADVLRLARPSEVEVWHERLDAEAKPRGYFRRYDLTLEGLEDPPIEAMIDEIRCTLAHRSYIDVGWTMHSLFPLLVDAFGDTARFVLQLRHPFDAAASHAIRGAYREWKGRARWEKHCFLDPSDNVFFAEPRWSVMTPFEKCLWRWRELICYWDELRERFPQSTFQVVRAEEVFDDPSALTPYFELLELETPRRQELIECAEAAKRNATRDDRRYWFGLRREWRRYFDFAEVIEFASRYGYDSSVGAIRQKRHRYAKPLDLPGRLKRKLLGLTR